MSSKRPTITTGGSSPNHDPTGAMGGGLGAMLPAAVRGGLAVAWAVGVAMGGALESGGSLGAGEPSADAVGTGDPLGTSTCV